MFYWTYYIGNEKYFHMNRVIAKASLIRKIIMHIDFSSKVDSQYSFF